MKEMELSNESLSIRPFKYTDNEALYEAAHESIENISLWMTWCHEIFSLDDSKKCIESSKEDWSNGNEYNFAIIDNKDGNFLGVCGLTKIDKDNRIANTAYWVRSSEVGKGIASSALGLLAQFAFNELKFNRIEIIPAIDNKASQRVATKAGAIKEGIMRKRIVVGDKIYDGVMFSLIPGDLKLKH
jgi:ribosomal-protein-serine acetyltransferase